MHLLSCASQLKIWCPQKQVLAPMVYCFVRVSPLCTFHRQVLPRDLAPGAEYPVPSSVLSRCAEPTKDRRSGDDCEVVSPGCSLTWPSHLGARHWHWNCNVWFWNHAKIPWINSCLELNPKIIVIAALFLQCKFGAMNCKTWPRRTALMPFIRLH